MRLEVGHSSIGIGACASALKSLAESRSAWPSRSGRKLMIAALSAAWSTSPEWAAMRSPFLRASSNAGTYSAKQPRVGLPEKSTPTMYTPPSARSLAASSIVAIALSRPPVRSTESINRTSMRPGCAASKRASSSITARTHPSASASCRSRGVVRSSRYLTLSSAKSASTSEATRRTAASVVTVLWIAAKMAKHASSERSSSGGICSALVSMPAGASSAMVESRAHPLR